MTKAVMLWLWHNSWDARIQYKEWETLQKNWYDVTCIRWNLATKNGKWEDWEIKNYWIKWNKLQIFIKSFNLLKKIKPKIVIAHDVESYILLVVYKFFYRSTITIFDSHEYYDKIPLNDYNIGGKVTMVLFKYFIKPLSSNFWNGYFTVTEDMQSSYPTKTPKETIFNYPLTNHIKLTNSTNSLIERYKDSFTIIYQGWLTKKRSILEIIKLLNVARKEIKNINAIIVWSFSDKAYEQEVHEYINVEWLASYVNFTWRIDLNKVFQYTKVADMWINLLESNFNNNNWIQIKNFEYLACWIPVLWTNNNHNFNQLIVDKWFWENYQLTDITSGVNMINKIYVNLPGYKNKIQEYAKYTRESEEEKLLSFIASISWNS